MKRYFLKTKTFALVFILLAGVFSCQKSVFVPEVPVNPEAADDPGVYEEGLYVTVKGAGLFTGEDWNNAMSVYDLLDLLLADKSGVFSAEKAAKINGKIIHLEQGIYPLASADRPLPIISGETANFSVTIKGGYKNGGYTQYPDKYHTYLSGASDYQIFALKGNVTLTLDGVGLTGSRGEGGGKAGVVLSGGSVLKMKNVDVSNAYNSATSGAFQVNDATLEATDCRFFNNVANFAGALNLGSPNSVCTLTRCEFYNNASNQRGGAIKVTTGTLKANNCVFRNNHAETNGGAMWIAGCKDAQSVVFDGCTFEGNSCTNGGGVCWMNGGAAATFKNCDFTNNFASNGSAGALYATDGNDTESWDVNRITVENCRFAGNNSVAYNGGSLHVRGSAKGNSEMHVKNCTFKNEYTTANAAVVAMGGTGAPIATFDNCVFSGCHSSKNSSVFYNYATNGKTYFNACVFEDNYITENNYGTEANIGTAGVFIGFNNCAVSNSCNNRVGANSQQSCWYNFNSGKILFSNSSIIGTPTSGGKQYPSYGLVRLNGNAANVHFVNNIIVSDNEAGCSIYGGDTQTNLTVTGSYNKLSPTRTQKEGTFTYNKGTGDELNAYASSFPGLAWGEDGWAWSGTYANASSFAQTSAVNNAIKSFDADFHAWLNSIGALGKDIRGKDRGATSWPGSYQN